MKVLVIEHLEKERMKITSTLRLQGHEVFEAINTDEAMEIFKKKYRLHMIILSLEIPTIDGISLCRSLKSMSPPPILMLTNEVTKEIKKQGTDVGVWKWLLRPISDKVLLETIQSLPTTDREIIL